MDSVIHFQDILPLRTVSEGDHCTCKHSCVNCTEVVLWWFFQMKLWKSGLWSSRVTVWKCFDCEFTHRFNGLLFSHTILTKWTEKCCSLIAVLLEIQLNFFTKRFNFRARTEHFFQMKMIIFHLIPVEWMHAGVIQTPNTLSTCISPVLRGLI